MKKEVKVLCVVDYYLPGFKAGGPIRTLVNMCDSLSDEIDFSILTRDRDLGDNAPFSEIASNEWQSVGSARVFYANQQTFAAAAVEQAITGDHVLYLNSFFSPLGSISLAWKFRNRAKILIAPRGEFSKGALIINSLKKRTYIAVAKLLGIYDRVHWHASTDKEAEDIERIFPDAAGRIHLAVDPVVFGDATREVNAAVPEGGTLKLAFISRISPKKNLDGLLTYLSKVDRSVLLAIYGPIEDSSYWTRCKAVISELPSNVEVQYCGTLHPDEVSSSFAGFDLFAFPTHGENFGHVIFESLRAGTPVLLSDQTPWEGQASGAVTVVPLTSPDRWVAQIEAAADRTVEERERIRAECLEYAHHYALNDKSRSDNVRMFESVANAIP